MQTNFDESEFLDFTPTPDLSLSAASGINWLFDNFPYKIHTLQFLNSTTDKSHAPSDTFTDRKDALESCLSYNKKGYDIFFMVNEGDGVVHEGKRIARSQASVTSLSRLFIDTDDCPRVQVDEYLKSIGLVPHFIINSSPGRFHYYFFLSPLEKTPSNIDLWRQAQLTLAKLGTSRYQTDKSMNDYAKVLRVPGFYHISKRHLVCVDTHNDIPPYDPTDVFQLISASNVPAISPTDNDSTHVQFNGVIEPGDRYQALQTLSLQLANTTEYSEAIRTFTEFIRDHLNNTDHVYLTPSGILTHKSLSLLDSAFSKVDREVTQQVAIIQQGPPPPTPETSPWYLPDSFYLSAPGGFGDVVRQVMHYSIYPCASLAFGTFITGLSLLKSKTHLTPNGSSPALYTLNIAPSGYGKNAPMSLLQNTLVANGLGSLISNEVRSDRGLYNHLASNNGSGLLILDEIAPLLRAIQVKEASSHLANISKAFLHLYSASAMKGLSLGKVTTSNTKKGEKEIVLDNPMLAICGYTVKSQFDSLFNADSVSEGLFQRFIPIVTEPVDVEANPTADSHTVIQSPLFTQYLNAQEMDSDGNPVDVPPLVNLTRVRMSYSPGALKMFQDLQRRYRKKLIETAKDQELAHTSGLYSRLAEQVERVATVLSQDEITESTLEYATQFLESRHKAIMAVAETTILRGKGSEVMRLESYIVDTVTRLCIEQETNIVPIRDVHQRLRRHFTNKREFDAVVAEGVASEKLVLDTCRKPGKGARRVDGIKLGDTIE